MKPTLYIEEVLSKKRPTLILEVGAYSFKRSAKGRAHSHVEVALA